MENAGIGDLVIEVGTRTPEEIAAEIIEVDTPGLSSPRLDLLAYRRIPRPIYPFDRDMHWSPSAGA